MELQSGESLARRLEMRGERAEGHTWRNATFSGRVGKGVSTEKAEEDRWVSQRQKGQERSTAGVSAAERPSE